MYKRQTTQLANDVAYEVKSVNIVAIFGTCDSLRMNL